MAAPVSSTATSLRKSSQLPPANVDHTSEAGPVNGNRNLATKPVLLCGNSCVGAGCGVSLGLNTPAVVGKNGPVNESYQAHPATVTSCGVAGSMATASITSWFTRPRKGAAWGAPVPEPS